MGWAGGRWCPPAPGSGSLSPQAPPTSSESGLWTCWGRASPAPPPGPTWCQATAAECTRGLWQALTSPSLMPSMRPPSCSSGWWVVWCSCQRSDETKLCAGQKWTAVRAGRNHLSPLAHPKLPPLRCSWEFAREAHPYNTQEVSEGTLKKW